MCSQIFFTRKMPEIKVNLKEPIGGMEMENRAIGYLYPRVMNQFDIAIE